MIGRGKAYHLDDEEMRQVNCLLSCVGSFSVETPLVQSYDKAFALGITFYSRRYTRVKKRNSYTVAYQDPLDHSTCYGIVETFISVTNSYNLALCVKKQVGPPHNFRGIISD